MNQGARHKADIARAILEQRQDLYQRTGNPVHVWHAFVLARRLGVALPSWVLAYLDGAAGALTAPDASRSPQAIAGALGLATKGGPSKARQAKTDERDLDIAGRVWALQDYARAFPGQDPDVADLLSIQLRVADEYQLSLDRVQAIYQRLMRPGQPASVPEAKTRRAAAGSSSSIGAAGSTPAAPRQSRARSRRTNS